MNPNLVELQDPTRDALAKLLGMEPASINKEIRGQNEVRFFGSAVVEGVSKRVSIVIKQEGKRLFRFAGTIYEDKDSYMIGKQVNISQIESIPTVLGTLISAERIKPKKRKLF